RSTAAPAHRNRPSTLKPTSSHWWRSILPHSRPDICRQENEFHANTNGGVTPAWNLMKYRPISPANSIISRPGLNCHCSKAISAPKAGMQKQVVRIQCAPPRISVVSTVRIDACSDDWQYIENAKPTIVRKTE